MSRRIFPRWLSWAPVGMALLGCWVGTPALAQVPSQEPFGSPATAPCAADTEPRHATSGGSPRWRLSGGPAGGADPTTGIHGQSARQTARRESACGRVGREGGTAGRGARCRHARHDRDPVRVGRAAAPGQSLPPNPPPSARFDSPATLENHPGNVKFGPGFEIRSDDDEFILQFHNLTQFDYRGYEQGGQDPVHDTFVFPRQWFMFSGRMTQAVRLLRLAGQRLRHPHAARRLPRLRLRPPAPVPGRPLQDAVHLRVLRRADPGPAQPRALGLLQQLRPEPRPRRHGLRPALRQDSSTTRPASSTAPATASST